LDVVQRQLRLLDEQFGDGRGFLKQLITKSPLLFAATGLIVGIVLQDRVHLSVWLWLILLIACTVSVVSLFTVRKTDRSSSCAPAILSFCALICFACLGAVRLTSYYQPGRNDIRNFVGDEKILATVRGTLITGAHLNKRENWRFYKYTFYDPPSSFYMKLDKAWTADGWTEVTGIVRVQVSGPVLDLKMGDYIEAYCWLDRFAPTQNPGQFDIAGYMAKRNVHVGAYVKSRDGIKLLHSGSAGPFVKISNRLKEIAAAALLDRTFDDDENQALLQALLLGVRTNIDSDTYSAFRRTGLLHFISLSGLHVGILIGIIWWLCKKAGLLKFGRAVVCIIATALFILIVPQRAPTLRAGIICSVFCAGFVFRRRPNPLNSLSLAAIILLLIRPTNIFNAGWQLSFACVFALLLFCERIHFFLYEKITSLSWGKKAPKTRPLFRIISRPGPYLLRLFSTGLTAWLGSAGILLYHFNTITPLSSLWTVVVFPLVAMILTFGFLKIILTLLLPTVGVILGVVVTGLSVVLIWLVQKIAGLGVSEILIGKVSLGFVLCYYCFFLFAGLVRLRRLLMKKVICIAAVIVLVAFLGVTKWQRGHRDYLALNCMAVGHGQAILTEFPGGTNILFDAGSLTTSDCGTRIVTPFLNYKGTNKIDAILISHNDADHVNGIPEVAQTCKVGAVYANNAFLRAADKPGTAKFLKQCLDEVGLTIQPADKTMPITGAAKVTLLWPDEQIWPVEGLSDNDRSQVILVEFAGRRILLCSDIEKFAQTKFVETHADLKADVVVVPHHGSAKTLAAGFLEKLEAGILIFSCGRRQYERYVAKPGNDVQCFYTARDGAITIRIEKDGTINTTAFNRTHKKRP